MKKLLLILALLFVCTNVQAQYPKHCPSDGQFVTWANADTQFVCSVAVLPISYTKVTHQWLDSYNSSTGLFTSSQPNFTDLSGTISTSTQMPNSGVTAGSYTNTNLTVNAQGLVTAASNGSAGSGGAWTLISSQVLGSAAATVTFSSIPGTYNHLKLIINGRASDATTNIQVQAQFNGDTGGNQYDWHEWRQTNSSTAGSVVLSTKMAFGNIVAASADANTAGSIEVLIPNYAGTTFYKHFISHFSTTPVFNNGASWVIGTYGGQWRSTAAITSILLFDGSGGNFVTGSSFYLYGIT